MWAASLGGLAHQMVCKCVCVCEGDSHLLTMFLVELKLGLRRVYTAVSQGGKTYTFQFWLWEGTKIPCSTVPETQ